jgi:Zn-dependent membrane protease YugP
MWFDPMYFLFLAPGMLLAAWAQWKVHSAYAAASEIPSSTGLTGAEAAAEVLHAANVQGVGIEPVEGHLSDHYDPSAKVLRLSEGVYGSNSLAALGIAAHEAGHAIQDARRYPMLVIRSAMVPLAGFGSNISWILIMIGFMMQAMALITAGIIAFSATVAFQLVNLPVEFDASRRARVALLEGGIITPSEDQEVKKVLDAAALTYVAATLTSILTLLYFLYRAGLLGGRRD